MENKIMNEMEIPKHKKRKDSSTSKIKSRTDHKHEYIDCLLESEINERNYFYKAECCKRCGKIQHVKFFESLTLSPDEIREKYKGLPKFRVKDIFGQKYVTVEKGKI